jgi:uncharacterized membrane protein
MKRIHRWAMATVMLVAVVAVPSLATAAPAQAATVKPASFNGQCWSGIDSWGSNHWAWGACTGTGTFRLHADCTFFQSVTSQPVTVNGGNARIDVQCPLNTTVTGTAIWT